MVNRGACSVFVCALRYILSRGYPLELIHKYSVAACCGLLLQSELQCVFRIRVCAEIYPVTRVSARVDTYTYSCVCCGVLLQSDLLGMFRVCVCD